MRKGRGDHRPYLVTDHSPLGQHTEGRSASVNGPTTCSKQRWIAIRVRSVGYEIHGNCRHQVVLFSSNRHRLVTSCNTIVTPMIPVVHTPGRACEDSGHRLAGRRIASSNLFGVGPLPLRTCIRSFSPERQRARLCKRVFAISGSRTNQQVSVA
jgi:hypothetical protein